MRILVLANLPPYVLGGAENQVARLADQWMKLGHHVEVAGHKIPNGSINLNNSVVITHHIASINWLGRIGKALSYFISISSVVLRHKYNFDIIYCRGLGDAAISICILKAMGFINLPLIACPINAKGVGDAHFIRSIPGWRFLVPIINKQCNVINIIAPAIELDIAALGIKGPQISHIPNGIEIKNEPSRLIDVTTCRFAWAGRIVSQKGLDSLLHALSKVTVRTSRNFILEIVGDGPELASLQALCTKLQLEKYIYFRGPLPIDEIRNWLSTVDVFLLPSRYEGMSNAALEAMEASLPILLTHCGGIDTYINSDVGWVCNPDDIDSLTTTLLGVLETPTHELLSMGSKARLLVKNSFEIHSISRQNIDLMEQLVSKAG